MADILQKLFSIIIDIELINCRYSQTLQHCSWFRWSITSRDSTWKHSWITFKIEKI